ncbi:MAG: chromate transporter [Bdellovibrionales bacterium]
MISQGPTKTVSLRDWFYLNLKIGALSFGGGGRVLLYQDAVIEHYKWMEESEFQEILTISQLVPGPNLVNLSLYLGFRLSGYSSALLGLVALALPGVAVILLVNALVDLSNIHVGWLFKGFSIASATIFLIFLLRFVKGLLKSSNKNKKTSALKITARFVIAFCVGYASLNHVPLSQILLIGLGISLIAEWVIP